MCRSQPVAAVQGVIAMARSTPAKSPSGASAGIIRAVPAAPPPTGKETENVSIKKATLDATVTSPSVACRTAFAVASSPRCPTIPTTMTITKNRADSSGIHHPSSQQSGEWIVLSV